MKTSLRESNSHLTIGMPKVGDVWRHGPHSVRVTAATKLRIEHVHAARPGAPSVCNTEWFIRHYRIAAAQ